MSAERKSRLAEIMSLAWQFVKRNGFSMSNALKIAWRNVKLTMKMQKGIVKFYYQKVDGSIREAYGTLKSSLVPATGNGRKENVTVQVYYDSEVESWRSFKKANLMQVAF